MYIGLYKKIWGNNAPATETPDPKYKGLDLLSGTEILTHLLDGQARAVQSVYAAIPQLDKAADAISQKLQNNNSRLIYAGAGSAGLLALQDAMEINPTFGWPLERQLFLMAGGDDARLKPIGAAENSYYSGEIEIKQHNITSDDIVIIVSASGTTPYSLGLLEAAIKVKALTVAIANNPGSKMLLLADHNICLESGVEVIAGSTRLGAGTAQKAALGMLSTLFMSKMGHIVDGFMVNMVADNEKLVERAARIVASIAEVELNNAERALRQTKGVIKPAILIAMGLTLNLAEAKLAKADGNLRLVMGEIKNNNIK